MFNRLLWSVISKVIFIEKIITALYCRLSREDERNENSSSIETQKRFLKRYANEHNFDKTKYYVDDGYSGTNFERPALQELLKEIGDKTVGSFIVKDLSRLGRNYLTTGLYIENYFPINNVRLIASMILWIQISSKTISCLSEIS